MNFILERAKAVSLRVVIAAILVIASIIYLLLAQSRYLSNFFAGPAPMTHAELAAVRSADSLDRYWVRLDADRVHDTGIEEITERRRRRGGTSRSVSGHFYVAEMGDRLLLIKAHEVTPGLALQGELKHISATTEREVLSSRGLSQVKPLFLPVMLDTEDFRDEGYIGLGIAAVVALLALYFGISRLRRFIDPNLHPVTLRANKWGPLPIISSIVESELQEGDKLKIGGHLLTSHHLYKNGLFKLTLENLDELVWAYLQVTKNKVMYIIPAGKTYALKLHWDQREVTLQAKEELALEALERIAHNRPWLPVGHTDELAEFFKKQKARFVAQVRKARADAKSNVL